MKRFALRSALTAVLAIFVFGGVATAATSEVINRTLFVAGDVVTISQTVNGDVFCAGKTVFITGTINGDVFCAGQEVNISGTVNGSVRAAGQSVSIAGTVQRAISLAGQSVSIQPDAKIGGDATLAGSSIVIAGALARDAYAAGETVTITGSIARDLEARTDNLTVSGEASIGAVNQIKSPAPTEKEVSSLPMSGLKLAIGFNIVMFITAMVLVLIAPQRFNGLANETLKNPAKVFAIGFAASILLPAAIILLAVTLVGIPLAILLALIWAVAGFLSGPVFAYILGRRLMSDSKKPIAIMAFGSLLVLLLYFIPVINLFVGMAAYIMGLGALATATGRALGKPKYTA